MQQDREGKNTSAFSSIGFGGAAVSGEGKGYGFGKIQEKEAIHLLEEAFAQGIDVFDTAPVYGFGMSEKRIGKAFRHCREKVHFFSKSGVTWDYQKRIAIDNSPQVTQRMLEQSLRDLDTDYIDVYFIHWPDPKIDIRKPMEILSTAKEKSQIRAIGLSNTNLEELKKASEIECIDWIQGEFNLFNTSAQDTLFPWLEKHDIHFTNWGTFDKGILTGRVHPRRTFDDPCDLRSYSKWWCTADRTDKFSVMEKIQSLADRSGHSLLEISLGFVLQYSQISTALCGIRSIDQLNTLIAAREHLPEQSLLQQCHDIASQALS